VFVFVFVFANLWKTCAKQVCVYVCVCVYVLAMVDEPRLYTSALTTDCQRRLMLTNQ